MSTKVRGLTILLLALAIAVAGCERQQQTEPTPTPVNKSASTTSGAVTNDDVAATPSTASSNTTAVQAFVDPLTGEMRAPTDAELAALQKNRTQTAASVASSSSSSVNVTHLPNGMTQYDLGTRGHVEDTACIQPDGSLGECNQKQREQLNRSSASP